MHSYDPSKAPNQGEWLTLDVGDQLENTKFIGPIPVPRSPNRRIKSHLDIMLRVTEPWRLQRGSTQTPMAAVTALQSAIRSKVGSQRANLIQYTPKDYLTRRLYDRIFLISSYRSTTLTTFSRMIDCQYPDSSVITFPSIGTTKLPRVMCKLLIG